jgi:hypothetical protein
MSLGRLEWVNVKNRRGKSSSDKYGRIMYVSGDGKIDTIILTRNDVNLAKDRADKNPTSVTNPGFWDRFLAFWAK